ncbi:MAG: MFS transporter [Marinicaulis sp.]|nr:MFS transporter [Marinicaulis sp.]NNE42284.1 MFS transporter [Marinicaulis sp.]NNL88644.1 MFS transporter [Marinicaulis sp.]
MTSAKTPAPIRPTAYVLLLAGAVCAGMGQTIVFSVLPPLAREIGLTDRQVVTIFMTSAIFWVLTGPQWGRRSDISGRKIFIFIGLFGFGVSMLSFGAMIKIGLLGGIAGMPLFLLLITTRSLYGIVGSAGPPAAQAYIADRTSLEKRTAGIANFSAAFGLGAMIGPGFGAVFSVIEKTAPFFAIGVVALVMSVVVVQFLPEKSSPLEREQKVKVKLSDKRIRPFIIYGVGFGFTNAILIQTITFYFIDVLEVSTEAASQIAGIGLMTGAMAALFSQLVIVQRFNVEPRILLRVAPVLLVLGHTLIWALPELGPVIFGMTLAGFGAGLAVPGFNAAASIAVTKEEQGSAIGLASAAGASGFIIAPLIGIQLYIMGPQIAYMFTSGLGVALLVFAMFSAAVGEASPKRIAAAIASSERDPATAPYQ